MNVKICSSASNEAYFLPQWIYHHFYMGFNSIDLYINNTVDNTKDILAKLQSYFPNISVYNSDWVFKYYFNRPPTHFIIAAINTMNYYNTAPDIDYTLFIDVDEYWTPLVGTEKIQDCINNFKRPDMILFQWLMIDGQRDYLMPLFSCPVFWGNLHPLPKPLIRSGLKPMHAGVHAALIKDIGRICVGSGEDHLFNAQFPGRIHPVQSKLNSYFILHDALSQQARNFGKYASGHPAQNSSEHGVKKMAMRPMWQQMSSENSGITFKNTLPSDYLAGFRRMVRELDLTTELIEAKKTHLLFALSFLRQIYYEPESELTVRFKERFGSVEAMHKDIFDQLTALDTEMAACGSAALISPDSLASLAFNDRLNTSIAAAKLYPFEKDEEGSPLFLGHFLTWLATEGNFELIERILNDTTFLSIKHYGSDWFLPVLAQWKYKHGHTDEAKAIYQQLLYSSSERIAEYANICQNES